MKKALLISLRTMILMTFLLGFIYPIVMTMLTRAFFTKEAAGSLAKTESGEIQGSLLIGQNFKSDKYFWPRPSAIDYNPLPSGGTNLAPVSQDLFVKFDERRKAGMIFEMRFASASGLDPHISPDAARAQAPRIASARGRNLAEIHAILDSVIEARQWGFLGAPRVNVLRLNLELDK